MSSAFVYRLYDRTDQLLYVGMTNNVDRRRASHRSTQPWWPEVARMTVAEFSVRPDAAAAERHAILTEMPKYNAAGTPDKPGGRPSDRPSPEVLDALIRAQAKAEAAQAELRAAVRAALERGSVRQVAAALGISPTTVQAWSKQ